MGMNINPILLVCDKCHAREVVGSRRENGFVIPVFYPDPETGEIEIWEVKEVKEESRIVTGNLGMNTKRKEKRNTETPKLSVLCPECLAEKKELDQLKSGGIQ